MTTIRKRIAALGLAGVLAISGCTAVAASDPTATTSSSSTSETTTDEASGTDAAAPDGTMPEGGPEGGMGGTDVSSITTEEQLVAFIQDAYGDGGLGLHRGHQPIETILDEVLGISHDELHVRMDAGQNLSDVAEDLGVGTDALVEALVDTASPAIDALVADGTITQEEADAYLAALEEAYTWRVTWDGEEATPTFDGLDA